MLPWCVYSSQDSVDNEKLLNFIDTKLSFPLACVLSFLVAVLMIYTLIVCVRENDIEGVLSCIFGFPIIILFILWVGEIGIISFFTYAFYAIMIFIVIIIILFLGIL